MTTQVDVRHQIAERLKIARQRAGFTSAELFCQQHQMNAAQYQSQEAGEVTIPASQLIEYAEKLHMSLSYLLLGEEPDTSAS